MDLSCSSVTKLLCSGLESPHKQAPRSPPLYVGHVDYPPESAVHVRLLRQGLPVGLTKGHARYVSVRLEPRVFLLPEGTRSKP